MSSRRESKRDAKLAKTRESIKKRNEAMGGSGMEWLKLEEGSTVIRILPQYIAVDSKEKMDGFYEDTFYVEMGVHRYVGPDNANINCRKYIHENCPICELREELKKGSAQDQKAAKASGMWPSVRYYFRVVTLDGSPSDDGSPKIVYLAVGPKIMDDILATCADPDYGWADDPETGYKVTIERTGKKWNDTSYNVIYGRGSLPIEDAVLDALEDTKPLSEIFTYSTYEEAKSKYYGEDDTSTDDDQEDEKPARSSSSGDSFRRRRRLREEDVEPDTDEEQTEDEPEEKKDKKPERRASTQKSSTKRSTTKPGVSKKSTTKSDLVDKYLHRGKK